MIFLMDYGMHSIIKTHVCRGNKDAYRFISKVAFVFILVPMMIFTVPSISPTALSKTPMFIPSTPTGTTFGFVGIDYQYVIVTMNPDSSWMFDWGDGTNTSWLTLEANKTSIVQTHQWSAPGSYQLHVKFKSETVSYGIWSDAMIIEINTYSSEDFPNRPVLYTGKIQGIVGNAYTYSALATDPHEYLVCYRFDFGNGNPSEWTAYVPSGSSAYLSFAWEKPGVYVLRAQAKNHYGLESVWSDPVQVIMKNTSEDNGVSIDLLVIDAVHYQIIYTSKYNGSFYDPSSGASNDIKWKGGNVFLIDGDSDGRWEYLYAPSIGQIQPYIEPIVPQKNFFSDFPWFIILLIISIVLGIISVILVLIKKGYIYLYEEEVSVKK